MPTKKQKRIKKRLDRRQGKVDESRATFGTNDPDLGKFDRRLNRLKRTVNKAEEQGMNVNYDTTNASGEGVVKTTKVKSSINMNYSPNKMGHSPAEMESAKQERKDLLNINPIANHASGSWMSKHSKSAFQMGHSPLEKHEPGHEKPTTLQRLRNSVEPGLSKNQSGNSRQQMFDADGDGDTVFNDSNQDGTMASRAFNKIGKAIYNDLFAGGSERKRKLRAQRGGAKPAEIFKK